MSRIGKRLLKVPKDVSLYFSPDFVNVQVTGPLGSIKKRLSGLVAINVQDGVVQTDCIKKNDKSSQQMWGTTNALLKNWMIGVTKGFQKKILIKGLGYKVKLLSEKILQLYLGFSHPINYQIPEGISVEVLQNVDLIIKGVDKDLVGLVASQIHKMKKKDPYKGKGVFYEGEKITLKVGKTATKKQS